MSRRSIRTMAVMLTAAVTVGLGASAASAEEKPDLITINFAYHPNMHGGAPTAIGLDQGFFEDEGLKLNPTRFTSGAPEIDAMIAGQLDIGYLGPGAMPAVMRGDVALLTIDHPNAIERIVVSEDSGIDSVEDLKGKEILFATGTTGEFVVRAALESVGLTMADITPVNSPDESSTTAFIAGSADVVSVGPTFTAQALKDRDSKVIFESTSVDTFALPGFWIANKDFVANNRDLVDRFLRAFGKANDYRLDNLDSIIPEVQEFTGTPEADLQSQVDLTEWWSTDEINAAIKEGTVDKMLKGLNEMFEATGKMDTIADPSTYFNADATLAAYATQATTAPADRTDQADFPWIWVVIGVFLLALLAGIVFIIRRARA